MGHGRNYNTRAHTHTQNKPSPLAPLFPVVSVWLIMSASCAGPLLHVGPTVILTAGCTAAKYYQPPPPTPSPHPPLLPSPPPPLPTRLGVTRHCGGARPWHLWALKKLWNAAPWQMTSSIFFYSSAGGWVTVLTQIWSLNTILTAITLFKAS